MALGMMTKKFSVLRGCAAIILFLIFSSNAFCEDYVWTLAAEKFKYSRGQNQDSVTSSIAESIPSEILEKLSRSIKRNVLPDEQYERTAYKLRTERQSLYLQLSSENRKRDSIVLNNYSASKLKAEIKAQEKKIAELEEKIRKNIETQKKELEDSERKMDYIASGQYASDLREKNELDLYRELFKNIFIKEETYITEENVSFYQNDNSRLFSVSQTIAEQYESPVFAKQVYAAKINALITGTITEYENFVSISVDLYSYPQAKKIGTVTEIGTIADSDMMTASISRQLLPLLANAMPVELKIAITPSEAAEKLNFYIDGVLQKSENGVFILDSGIHTIQFVAEGYRTAGTTYSFEGNKKYNVDVNFEVLKTGYLQIGLRNSIEGDIYVNSEKSLKINDKKSQIKINGNVILGEFIAENGETAFFYIPKKINFDGNYVTIRPKPRNRTDYIDTRRKWMYGTYTLFMISMIPTFYTYGNFKNNARLYKDGFIDYSEARNWQIATNVTRVISATFGVLWGFELVRYLIAANSVLPQNAIQGDEAEFVYYEPEEIPAEDIGVNENEKDVR